MIFSDENDNKNLLYNDQTRYITRLIVVFVFCKLYSLLESIRPYQNKSCFPGPYLFYLTSLFLVKSEELRPCLKLNFSGDHFYYICRLNDFFLDLRIDADLRHWY